MNIRVAQGWLFLGGLLLCVSVAVGCRTSGLPLGRTTDECATACWRIVAADCGDVGEECVDCCVRTDSPPPAHCPREQQLYADCYWQTSSYTCHPQFGTHPVDCDAEFQAARVCLGLADASVTDAASDANSDAAPLSDAALTSDAASDH